MRYSALYMTTAAGENQTQTPNGWLPARPINYQYDRWRDRIKWAWGVLVGRYDALIWE